MVIVAVTLPILLLFVMFAIDVAHWFDYSRNLQNRADAAALAAGLEYGGTCAVSNPSATAMGNIGQVAQNYAGAGPTSDLFYPYQAANEHNLPNLTAGSLDHYHVLINSQNFWQSGQSSTSQSFTMGAPSTVCSSLDEDGKRGPFVDVKVTQDSLPFVPAAPRDQADDHCPRPGLPRTGHLRVECSSARGPRRLRHALRQCQLPQRQHERPHQDDHVVEGRVGRPELPDRGSLGQRGGRHRAAPSAGTNLADVYVSRSSWQLQRDEGYVRRLQRTELDQRLRHADAEQRPGAVDHDRRRFLTGCVSNTGAYNQYFTSTACQAGITANVAFAPDVSVANQAVTATDPAGTCACASQGRRGARTTARR